MSIFNDLIFYQLYRNVLFYLQKNAFFLLQFLLLLQGLLFNSVFYKW